MPPRHGSTASGARWLALALVVSTLTSCGSSGPTAEDLGDGATIRADHHVDEYGVSVAIRVGFDEAREVTGARLVAGGESVDASLYPLDGTDPDRQPERVSVGADDQVLVEGALLLPCPGAREAPTFEVVSEAGGARVVDLVSPADTEGYDRAVVEWCDRPITASVLGQSTTLQGDHELRVLLSNPGPEPVEVTSAQVVDGSSTWLAARTVVPAGPTELTIHGHGPPGCPAPLWESDHLRADGEVVQPGSAVAIGTAVETEPATGC